MTLTEMIEAVKNRVDDDQDNAIIIQWLNEGINEMAVAVNASFPQFALTGDMASQIPPFPEKYHHIPIIYACARFKEYDSSTAEADSFTVQFNTLLSKFAVTYEVPPYYRDDRLTQQFTAVEGQVEFDITKNGYDPRFGDLVVYKNGIRTRQFSLGSDKSFTLADPCQAGDKITALWEEHTDMLEPPHTWWSW